MIDLLKKDNIWFGILAGLVITILTAGILYIGLVVFKCDIQAESKIFLFAVVPEILLMRWYAKNKYHKSTKGVMIILVITLGLIMYSLYNMGHFANAFNWRI
ncbi:MAG: hypothetical protein LKE30_04445 [Bacteroidales bacterium]|jgi:hypothetical protein|nr:hypothetical protein [Bacteroidales bacterium]